MLSNIWLCCPHFSDHCWHWGWFSEGPSHLGLNREPALHALYVQLTATKSEHWQHAPCTARAPGIFRLSWQLVGSIDTFPRVKALAGMISRPTSPPPLGAVSYKFDFLSSLGHPGRGRPLLNLLQDPLPQHMNTTSGQRETSHCAFANTPCSLPLFY